MGIKVTVKIRSGSQKPRIENFGNNRYLAYLTSNSDEELLALLSRHLGTPSSRIAIIGSKGEDKILEVG